MNKSFSNQLGCEFRENYTLYCLCKLQERFEQRKLSILKNIQYTFESQLIQVILLNINNSVVILDDLFLKPGLQELRIRYLIIPSIPYLLFSGIINRISFTQTKNVYQLLPGAGSVINSKCTKMLDDFISEIIILLWKSLAFLVP